MSFANLMKVKAAQPQKKKEFDVKVYLDQRSKMTSQVDSYFVEEPIKLLAAAEAFDLANDFKIIELEDSLINILDTYC